MAADRSNDQQGGENKLHAANAVGKKQQGANAVGKKQQGADFDKEYLMGQLDGHKKLLMIQEDYLKVGQNREHLNTAKLARGMINEHIAHLEMMKA
jgi:predicted outer membrane protein